MWDWNYFLGLLFQTEESVTKLKAHLERMYERQNAIINEKLAALTATLDNIGTLDADLRHFRESLGSFYADMNQK